MKPPPTLLRCQAERDHLLEVLLSRLQQDERVQAAWVFGSLGRQDADALSDIDLIVVVRDDALQAVIAERYAFVAQMEHSSGPMLFFLEAPQNAPPGGAYLMVCFDAPTAPHIVDLYWQPESLAWDQSQARLLFARSKPVPSSQPPAAQRLPPGQPANLAGAELPPPVRFFWMMLLITAKYAGRHPQAPEMHLLPYVTQAYQESRELFGDAALPALDSLSGAPATPAHKIALLRSLAERMAGLPFSSHPALLSTVNRYLALIEKMMQQIEK